jgi:chlorophyll synthase
VGDFSQHIPTNYCLAARFCWLMQSLFSSCYRAHGLQSLPVAFGIDTAKWLTVSLIDITQLAVVAFLYYIRETAHANTLLALILPQMYFQAKYFLPDPIKNDVKYQASAQPFLVLGILVTALAVGRHGPLNM